MFAGKDFRITHTDTNLLAFNNRKKAWWFVLKIDACMFAKHKIILLWPNAHF